jgi:hypothetical protein
MEAELEGQVLKAMQLDALLACPGDDDIML